MNTVSFLQNWPARIIRVDVIGSTNTEAEVLLAKGELPDFTIVAKRQSAGRGQKGRAWQSPEGNLFLSAVLATDVIATRAGELAFVAANAVSDTIARYTGSPNVRVKWPNDVLLDNKKIAGILVENGIEDGHIRHSVIGIGINVREAPSIAACATDCIANHRSNISVEDVLNDTLAALKAEFQAWHIDGFTPVRDRWVARAWRMGELIAVQTPQGHVTGMMNGIDENGALLVRNEQQTTRISSGNLAHGTA